jgi:hypothetical protein
MLETWMMCKGKLQACRETEREKEREGGGRERETMWDANGKVRLPNSLEDMMATS